MIYYNKRGSIIRDPMPGDAARLAKDMRRADALEVYAASGRTPIEAVEKSLELTLTGNKFTVEHEEAIVAIFGIISSGSTGLPWMLTTDVIETVWLPFARESRRIVRAMSKSYSLLTNHVDARNTVSIEWLKWCGFTMEDAKPYGIFGLPYHRFEMRRDDDV